MEKKRNKLQIIHDILSVINQKNRRIKPTHILYKSNLSYSMMEQYLNELIAGGMIKQIQAGKNKTYEITQKGVNYLSQYSLVQNFTESFGLE
jgi:predicted transcriptional regulator